MICSTFKNKVFVIVVVAVSHLVISLLFSLFSLGNYNKIIITTRSEEEEEENKLPGLNYNINPDHVLNILLARLRLVLDLRLIDYNEIFAFWCVR